MKDYYSILEVARTASQEQITEAWGQKLEIWRPEKFYDNPSMQLAAQERLNEIREAYAILGNPQRREEYDKNKVRPILPQTINSRGSGSFKECSEAHPLAFHGSGRELFDIFIVNLLKTIVTAGIYYFWAKTATRQYLWGQSEFAGDRFCYHGTGKELLIGGLKASVIFGGLVVIGKFIPMAWNNEFVKTVAQFLYIVGLLLLFKIALLGSMRYRLSRTSWRGVRFSFRGRFRSLIKLSLLGYFYTISTLGLYYPYYQNELRRFLTKRTFFGSSNFKFDGRGKDLLKPFLIAIGSALAGMFVGLPLTMIVLGWFIPPGVVSLVAFLLFFAMLGSIGIAYAAKQRQYYWNHTVIGDARFESTITPGNLIKLYMINLMLIVFSLGFALPWVTVRTMRYNLDHLLLRGHLDLDHITQQAQGAQPTGDELAGFFNIDALPG